MTDEGGFGMVPSTELCPGAGIYPWAPREQQQSSSVSWGNSG